MPHSQNAPKKYSSCNRSARPYNYGMIQFWAITKNTFVQTIRQPIFGVMIFLTFVMLVISLPLSGWTMGSAGEGDYTASDQQMLENLGLSSLLLMGMITAALSASATVSREIEDKTALTVVAKPVPRGVFIVGKFSGVAMAVTMAYYLGMVVFLMTVQHKVVSNASTPINWPVVVFGCVAFTLGIFIAGAGNFLFGWAFISSAAITMLITLTAGLAAMSIVSLDWEFVSITETFGPGGIRLQLLVAMFLIYLAVILLAAVAVTASTRVGQILTLLITLAVLVAGSMHEWLISSMNHLATAGRGEALGAELLGWVLPNLTVFYPLDALARGWDVPASLVGLKFLYFACYTAAILAVGIVLFQRRQIEAQGSSGSMPGTVSLLSGVGRIIAIIVAVAVAVMLTQKRTYNLAGLICATVMIASALLGWIICSALGGGKKWSFWTITVIFSLSFAAGIVLWFLPERTGIVQSAKSSPALLMGTIISGLVLAALLLPKTRHHFKSQ